MKSLLGLAFTAALVTLQGCGGGGGGGDSAAPAVDEAGILENIKISNLYGGNAFSERDAYWGFEEYPECDDRSKLDDPEFEGDEGCPRVRSAPVDWEDETIGRLKKWDIASDGLIPVKHNNSQYAHHAMDVIETKMGVMLFDRNSIVNVDYYEVERGLIVSEGTATGMFGGISPSICGTVESRGSQYALGGENSEDPSWFDENGVIFGPLVIHIGQDDPRGCSQGQDLNEIAVHEFMHALGMDTHFQGFGIGPIYSDDAWNVLHNILINYQYMDEFELNIEKRFPEQE